MWATGEYEHERARFPFGVYANPPALRADILAALAEIDRLRLVRIMSSRHGGIIQPSWVAERPYSTYNGFYFGDTVQLPDGRRGCIDEIVLPEVYADVDGDRLCTYSVVRLDDELWLDGWLTRV